jgi:starch phosphorylase
MKVLVNGGLNLSELDGWWAEAYTPEVGWALGDGQEHTEPDWDAREAEELYRLLENEIVPMFYTRDASGVPRAWVARMRASLARLAPQFSTSRMLREYIDLLYLPAAAAYERRSAQNGKVARELHRWWANLQTHWRAVHVGNLETSQDEDQWVFTAHVYLGEIDPSWVRVELYADAVAKEEPLCKEMKRMAPIPGAINGYSYQVRAPATRPATDFTPRVIPYHAEARVPMEAALICWQR